MNSNHASFKNLLLNFRPRLVQDFQIIIMFLPFQYWDIVSMSGPWARHFTLTRHSWLRYKWGPGRTEMAMCTISSMRLNVCRTVCSPWSWNGIRTDRSSDLKSADKSSDLISDYKPSLLHAPFTVYPIKQCQLNFSQHETLKTFWLIVCPPSSTLARH